MAQPENKPNRRMEFTIIAGSLKGRTITSPDLGITRPPLSRLRRSIFDFLMPYIDSATYLDLFSGTGSYLFEAVSRGAELAIGVEREKRLADAINRQAGILGIASRLTCQCEDVFLALPALTKERTRFDIIMLAPPQYVGLVDQTLAALRQHPLSEPKGMIICQHDTSETKRINFLDFPILQRRPYGNTTFTVIGQQ
jgi:16S rRNA (guanine(966)-N(2))-methyltransferase RsmD